MGNRLLLIGKSLAAALLALTAVAFPAPSQDIVNPVLTYYELPAIDGGIDSLLTTKVTFDPLPEYGVQTKVTVEHYALFGTDSGMVVELRGEAVDRVMLHMPQYARLFPGPILQGDTLVAEFLITPLQVGIIPLQIVLYDNVELIPDKSVRVGAMEDISFILNADGETFGIASGIVSKRFSTVLGPSPELLSKDRIFRVEPRYPEPDLQWLELSNRPNYNPQDEIFDLEIRMQAVEDHPGQRTVLGSVIPYRDFDYGIAWQVSHSEELKVSGLDSCVLGPVKADSLYEFSFKVDMVSPGEAVLVINVVTPNPDFGVEGALFSKWPRAVGADVTLMIGIQDNLSPLFITDVPLKSYVKSVRKARVDPVTIDPRFAFVKEHLEDVSRMNTIQGAAFDFIMIHRKP